MRKIDPVDRHVRLIRLSSQEQGGRGRAAGYIRFQKTHKVHGDGAMVKICLTVINNRLWRVSSKINDIEKYKKLNQFI